MAQAYLGDLRTAPEPDGPWRHVTVISGTIVGSTLTWILPPLSSDASDRYVRVDNMRPEPGSPDAGDEEKST